MCVWFVGMCVIDTNCHIYTLIQNYICFLYRSLYSDFFFLEVEGVANINHCLNFVFSITGKQKEDFVSLFSSPF